MSMPCNSSRMVSFKWQNFIHQLLLSTSKLLQKHPLAQGPMKTHFNFLVSKRWIRFSLLGASFEAWTPLFIVHQTVYWLLQKSLNWRMSTFLHFSTDIFPTNTIEILFDYELLWFPFGFCYEWFLVVLAIFKSEFWILLSYFCILYT